jgi:hypothetical protein
MVANIGWAVSGVAVIGWAALNIMERMLSARIPLDMVEPDD